MYDSDDLQVWVINTLQYSRAAVKIYFRNRHSVYYAKILFTKMSLLSKIQMVTKFKKYGTICICR